MIAKGCVLRGGSTTRREDAEDEGSAATSGRAHPALAHLPEPIARAAAMTLLEAAIAHIEGRRWPAHHVERRFIRRWRRWCRAGHLTTDEHHEAEARRIVGSLARLPRPRPATDERRARPAPARRVLVGRRRLTPQDAV